MYSEDINDFNDDISNWNIYKILNYIKVNYKQFLLLMLVVIIVYVIDHISNVNALLFGLPSSIPGLNTQPLPIYNLDYVNYNHLPPFPDMSFEPFYYAK